MIERVSMESDPCVSLWYLSFSCELMGDDSIEDEREDEREEERNNVKGNNFACSHRDW